MKRDPKETGTSTRQGTVGGNGTGISTQVAPRFVAGMTCVLGRGHCSFALLKENMVLKQNVNIRF